MYLSGFEVCINQKILEIGIKYHGVPRDRTTYIVDVEEISFHYYLSKKHPFF